MPYSIIYNYSQKILSDKIMHQKNKNIQSGPKKQYSYTYIVTYPGWHTKCSWTNFISGCPHFEMRPFAIKKVC